VYPASVFSTSFAEKILSCFFSCCVFVFHYSLINIIY